MDNNTRAFLALVRAGLWETEARLLPYEVIDYKEVSRLAQEQTVEGLVAAGLEHVVDTSIPKEIALSYAGIILQYEKLNLAMNQFIAHLFSILDQRRILALLVKGQGIAQCYERPLWRACGDVDLLFDKENYTKSKEVLSQKSQSIEPENSIRLHQGMTMGPWEVELHGTLRNELLEHLDNAIESIQEETFKDKSFRIWNNNGTKVLIPAPDSDVLFVFTHIIQHFFNGGIGLRQLCDWCRLLWTFKDILNRDLLGLRLQQLGLKTEWKAFAAFAVNWLGMPEEAMPFYTPSSYWNLKATGILYYILETGNMGHNRDLSYLNKDAFFIKKMKSLWWHTWDLFRHFVLFPLDSVKVWWRIIKDGICYGYKELNA